MEQVLVFLQSYWGIFAVGIGFGIYGLFERQKAKDTILSLMLQVEKNAETLALTTGDEKFQFVVDNGYQALPAVVKTVVTKEVFQTLARNLYDSAKSYLTQNK